MLNRITLKNFKLHAHTEIDAAPLTVFIGPNNSGKSSVFQALLLWRQGASRNWSQLCAPPSRRAVNDGQPYLFETDQLLDVGEFPFVVKHGENDLTLGISGLLWPRAAAAPISADCEVRVRENQLVYHRGELNFETLASTSGYPGRFAWQWILGQGTQQTSIPVNFKNTSIRLSLQPQGNLRLLAGGGFEYSGPLPPDDSLAAQEMVSTIEQAPLKLLTSTHSIFSIRGFEESGYPLPDTSAGNLDRMVLQDRTMALLSILAYDRRVEQRLSAWLDELLGIQIEAKLLPGKRVTLLTSPAKSAGSRWLFSNEGTGASQLPFILVPIGLTPQGDTILLSEPEAHLHPRAQVDLTRLLITLMKKESRQFFIETHSEHVLHALLNSVAKGTITTQEVAIYYFENKAGQSVCTRLQVNERGSVEGGLPGFFDQSLGELSEYLDALKSK
jgi:predicted ATPase